MCQRRSTVRSECAATRTINNTATRFGTFENTRQPHGDAVGAGVQAKVDKRKPPKKRAREPQSSGAAGSSSDGGFGSGEILCEPGPFLRTKPVGVLGPLGKIVIGNDAE